MQPTNNFRLVLLKETLIGETEHRDRVFGTVKVLQQKWCDSYGKCEWRDVEVVEE